MPKLRSFYRENSLQPGQPTPLEYMVGVDDLVTSKYWCHVLVWSLLSAYIGRPLDPIESLRITVLEQLESRIYAPPDAFP